jgi:hypothetical protein
MPKAAVEPQADERYAITLTSDNANAKIYYTTDGQAPTVHSTMYNISAPHWQPELNVPFAINGETVVRAIAVATGFANSPELSFSVAGSFIPGTAGLALMPPPLPPDADPNAIKVIINGKRLAFDVPPQNMNGSILVPLRAIFEEMGAKIDYVAATRTVTATKGDTVVVLTIGDTSPTVRGKVVPIDQPGIIVSGRTLAPLRFVAEAFGGTVTWDGASNTANITKAL